MGCILSTLDVEEPERLAYWCDLVCDTFVKLDVNKISKTPSFFGSIDTRHLDYLQFSHVKSENQRVIRSARQIAKAPEDYFLISVQLSGSGAIVQDGQTAQLQEGQFCLYNTTRIYELLFAKPFEQLVLQMPADKLNPLLVLPEKTVAKAVNGCHGLGKVTLDLIMSTYREVEDLRPQQLGRVSDIIVELLAACLNQSVCAPGFSSRTRITRLFEIKHFIGSRLHDAMLNVDMVADVFRVSPRYVHMLFEDEDTTAAGYIRELRLQKCKQDLLDVNHSHRSLTDIAFSWGFNSSAHFSRLFSERFGVSPREFRAMGSDPA